MKRNGFLKRFWIRLFFQIGVIFAAFVLLLTLCNTAFLERYYEFARGRELRAVSTQVKKVELSDSSAMVDLIRNIQEVYVGNIILVRDSFGHVAPYLKPKLKELL